MLKNGIYVDYNTIHYTKFCAVLVFSNVFRVLHKIIFAGGTSLTQIILNSHAVAMDSLVRITVKSILRETLFLHNSHKLSLQSLNSFLNSIHSSFEKSIQWSRRQFGEITRSIPQP